MIYGQIHKRIKEAASKKPCVVLLGPWMSGKTTAVKSLFSSYEYKNLEEAILYKEAKASPQKFLANCSAHDGVIIDGLEYLPELVSYLIAHLQKENSGGKWILISAQKSLSEKLIDESDCEVIFYCSLSREDFVEEKYFSYTMEQSLYFGSVSPAVILGSVDIKTHAEEYIRRTITYLEKTLGVDEQVLRDFLGLCAGRSSLFLDYQSLADDCGVLVETIKIWLSVLEDRFIIARSPPIRWRIPKMQLKQPKIYFYDTSLVCYLLLVKDPQHLFTHHHWEGIFENWVVGEIVKQRKGLWDQMWCYADRTHNKVDLVITDPHSEVWLIEIAAFIAISMELLGDGIAVQDLLKSASIPAFVRLIHAGEESFDISGHQFTSWRDVHTLFEQEESSALQKKQIM